MAFKKNIKTVYFIKENPNKVVKKHIPTYHLKDVSVSYLKESH